MRNPSVPTLRMKKLAAPANSELAAMSMMVVFSTTGGSPSAKRIRANGQPINLAPEDSNKMTVPTRRWMSRNAPWYPRQVRAHGTARQRCRRGWRCRAWSRRTGRARQRETPECAAAEDFVEQQQYRRIGRSEHAADRFGTGRDSHSHGAEHHPFIAGDLAGEIDPRRLVPWLRVPGVVDEDPDARGRRVRQAGFAEQPRYPGQVD
jgi:hypothetical protein